MRLLILTQKMDRTDPILGFFEGWVRALAPSFEYVTVLCLARGEVSVPKNVRIVSMGKDEAKGRLTYLWRFYRTIFESRNLYDVVFVHMNAEYVLLGALPWRALGKRIVLWYNHTAGGLSLRMAMRFSDTVCHTSPFARSAGTSKSISMPAGVDTRFFSPRSEDARDPRAILFLGRLDPLKRPELLLKAALRLLNDGETFTLAFVGVTSKGNESFGARLREEASELVERGIVTFRGAALHSDVPNFFQRAAIVVNLSPRGNYDKTVLEAAASGALLLVSSDAYRGDIPPECFFREGDESDLADGLRRLLSLTPRRRDAIRMALRAYADRHSLENLAIKLVAILHDSSQRK